MNPLRKHFDPSAAFPVSFVHKLTKGLQAELPDHLHDWYEIIYVHAGQGTFFINHSFYDMKPGDLFLIPGNTIHRSFPDDEQPLTSTAAFFSGGFVQAASIGDGFSFLRCFELAKKDRSYKLETDADLRAKVEMLLEETHEELTRREPGYRQAAVLLLQRLLLLLNRMVAPSGIGGQLPSAGGQPPWMKESLRHIDDHLQDRLSLSALAGRASVDPAHYSRVFKRLTGMNVTEYVTAKRIVRAKELLLETDATIREIADRCGFESLPHFHRMFKKIAGETPAQYKKVNRTD